MYLWPHGIEPVVNTTTTTNAALKRMRIDTKNEIISPESLEQLQDFITWDFKSDVIEHHSAHKVLVDLENL